MSRRHGLPGRCTPRRPKPGRTIDDVPTDVLELVARTDAAERGCTCPVLDLSLRHTGTSSVGTLRIQHDEGCPAIAEGGRR